MLSGSFPFSGIRAWFIPSRLASFSRCSRRWTLRISPESPSSPMAMVCLGTGIPRWLLTMARARAKSEEVSFTFMPPAMLANTSDAPMEMPPNFSSRARMMVSRLGSMPAATRWGTAKLVWLTSAWVSKSMARVPSIVQHTTFPGVGGVPCCRNTRLGFSTGVSPCPVISKTPISSVAPKRFLMERIMRYW